LAQPWAVPLSEPSTPGHSPVPCADPPLLALPPVPSPAGVPDPGRPLVARDGALTRGSPNPLVQLRNGGVAANGADVGDGVHYGGGGVMGVALANGQGLPAVPRKFSVRTRARVLAMAMAVRPAGEADSPVAGLMFFNSAPARP
jgi:hypothetical protein